MAVSINNTLLAAKKALDTANTNPIKLDVARKAMLESLKHIALALKTHNERKINAGGGVKKLSTCVVELTNAMKNQKDHPGHAVIKKFQFATTALEASTVKLD